ncbi:MAG: VWA domain-containing protein [Lentisphaeria bacterium]|nr:VWA domain-containing protein [Lentisphaeria bacterium]
MISLQYPWALTALLIPAAILIIMLYRKRPAVNISTILPVRRSGSVRRRRLAWQEIILLLGMVLLSVALAGPRRPLGSRIIRGEGVDIILALDMSQSMSCYDRPEGMSESKFAENISSGALNNRLESAKNEIRRFIASRPNDRIGLIGFADLAYSFVPPTLDHALLLERLKSLAPGELGNATGIASPIGSAAKRLQNAPSPRRILVLFTDGANTADNRLTPQAAAEAAKEFNVIIHTIGIGSRNTYAIQYGRLLPVQSDLDTKLLQELSRITGGTFFTAADSEGMKQVMNEINALEKTDHRAPQPDAYREYAPVIALAGAMLLLFGIITSSVIKVHLP